MDNKKNNYTLIHLHTDYSNGVTNIDSVTKYNEYVDRAVEEGMTAIAFTEHGNVFEYYKKHEYCKSKGIKYIHAAEFYLTKSLDKKVRDNYHCCIYAKNYDGFLELNELSSKSFNREDGHYYYNPRITFEELFATSDNLIISTSCIGGVLREDDEEIRKQYIDFLLNNKHRCFLEVQHHQDQQQKDYNKMIIDLHKETNIPIIYGSDTHALNERHARGRRVLQEAKNIFFSGEENWDIVFKTYDEAVDSFKKQGILDDEYILQAINNTNVLADMVEEYDFDTSIKYPKIFKDRGKLLIHKINEGVKKRGINKLPNYREYVDRIKTELSTIRTLKAEDYILLQSKMSEDGRTKGGVEQGFGRGSVNGSIIAYILGITEMDSIKYNLNFSRFLNPSRVTNADIDVDYSEEDREWMRDYLFSMEGVNAADIITFNTIALKGAIRDVGRAFKTFENGIHRIPDDKIDEIAKNIETKEEEYRSEFPLLFEYVDILNGTIVSVGSHPSGVLVSDLDIKNTIGLCSLKDNKNPVTQLSMKPLDALMYTKMDVLGLDSIGIINNTCKMVGIPRINPDNVDIYDEAVWDSIREDTTAIFQMESEMAHKYFEMITRPEVIEKIKKSIPNIRMFDLFMFVCGAIRPAGENFRDDACNGIIKDNGFKELNEFLHDTLGYLLLQEQIMGFLVKFCGYSEVESDNVRRCLDENTNITMADGNFKKIKDISVGDNVISVNEHGITEPQEVTNVFDNGVQEVYKVTTIHGKELIGTGSHKVFTQDGYKCIKDLKDDDVIMSLKNINSEKDNLKPNQRLSCSEMFMIGMLIGDGYIAEYKKDGNKNDKRPTLINSEIEIINKFKECVRDRRLKGECKFNVSYQNGKTVDKIYRVYIETDSYNKYLTGLLDKFGLRKLSKDKCIPSEFMKYPKGEKLENLLAGLFTTDGGNSNGIIDYSTISETLAMQIQSLLLKYGIYSYVSKSYLEDYNYYIYRVIIRQAESLQKFKEVVNKHIVGEKKDKFEKIIDEAVSDPKLYGFMMPSKCTNEIRDNMNNYNKSLNDIGYELGYKKNSFKVNFETITDKKVKEISRVLYTPYTYWLLNSEYIPLRIKSIELIGEAHVYDIEVKKNHNYIANGLVVHNCIAKKGDTEPMLEEIERRFLEHTPKTYGVPLEKAKEIIKPFLLDIKSASGYGFSGNHNNPYSLTGYIQGYLRYHYPLEFLTSCLNVWSSKTDKMTRVTQYALNKNIEIKPPKFRFSKSEYMCDKETNCIYKGLFSIKYLNERVAEELYDLRNNQYDTFVEFLHDAKLNTSIDFRQLKILTTLNFFSEFGKNGKLLDIISAYEKKLKNKNLKEETKAKRIVELIEFEKSLEDKSISIKEQIEAEIEYLGYASTANNKLSKSLYMVIEMDTQYTPRLKLYCLNDGSIMDIKCSKRDIELNPFGELSVITVKEIIKKYKRKKVNDEWVKTDERESFLVDWKVIS